ncbi:MAG: hypothetical protein WCK90_01720, partial [archaeon]
KAIRLLIAPSEKLDESIKILFKEYLGPLGDKEFEDLKNSKGINQESVNEYVESLEKSGIVIKTMGEEFKNKIRQLFNEKEATRRKPARDKLAKSFES